MTRSWLPIGSVVTLQEGVRPVMVVAVMGQDSKMGNAEADYFFDASMIREIQQLGLVDADALLFQAFLRRNESEYFAKRGDRGGGDRS